jgi:hypothetical protein
MHLFSYGADAQKRDASNDARQEAEARSWIEAVLGTPLAGDLTSALHDGVVLYAGPLLL